jgi:predicted amidohydrolase
MNIATNNSYITAAAIQLDTDIGNTKKNLAACKRLAQQACNEGAGWIALPEFFNTGVSWKPELVDAIENEEGPSATFLREFSQQYSVVIGGSFLCRINSGGIRNRYLCFNNGVLVGKHDKDFPTMWENAFYEAGEKEDIGYLGEIDGMRVGSAVCWEFLRTQTARRLRNKVDVIIGGSHWWSLPTNWPAWLVAKSEAYNTQNLLKTVQKTAQLIGAPIIHASHCNQFSCPIPGIPFSTYHGTLEGNAAIIDGKGTVLALRTKEQGEGIVIADVQLGSIETHEDIPNRFWLRRRTWLPAFSWHVHGFLGRRWYAKNVKNKKN